jgi:hypothetical protein
MGDRADFRGLVTTPAPSSDHIPLRRRCASRALFCQAIKSPTVALEHGRAKSDPTWGAFSEADRADNSQPSLHLPYAGRPALEAQSALALRPLKRTSESQKLESRAAPGTTVFIPPNVRHFLSSACSHDQALALTSRRAGPLGHNFNCAAGVVGLL